MAIPTYHQAKKGLPSITVETCSHPRTSWLFDHIRTNSGCRPFWKLPSASDRWQVATNYTPFSDQLWTICMKFGKSATNFDSPPAESCPNGRRNSEIICTFPNCVHCRLNWPEKGILWVEKLVRLQSFLAISGNDSLSPPRVANTRAAI